MGFYKRQLSSTKEHIDMKLVGRTQSQNEPEQFFFLFSNNLFSKRNPYLL